MKILLRSLHCLVGASLLASIACGLSGCERANAPVNAASPAPISQRVSPPAVPASTPSTATRLSDPYRLKVTRIGNSQATFAVFLNGAQIGDFNTDASQDITDKLHRGSNEIKIVWTSDPAMDAASNSVVEIGYDKNGQWNSVVNQRIVKETISGEKTLNLALGDAGDIASSVPPGGSTSVNGDSLETTAPSNSSANSSLDGAGAPVLPEPGSKSAPAITEKYQLKTDYWGKHSTDVEFTVSINGQQIGSFNANASQDITNWFNKGNNDVKIAWTASPMMASTPITAAKLTIGVDRGDGKWSTVANQQVRNTTKAGSKSVILTAK